MEKVAIRGLTLLLLLLLLPLPLEAMVVAFSPRALWLFISTCFWLELEAGVVDYINEDETPGHRIHL